MLPVENQMSFGMNGEVSSRKACRELVIQYRWDMKFRAVVELDQETGRWSAYFPELPGCATAGDTEAEAIRNAQEALELWFEPVPVNLQEGAKVVELSLS